MIFAKLKFCCANPFQVFFFRVHACLGTRRLCARPSEPAKLISKFPAGCGQKTLAGLAAIDPTKSQQKAAAIIINQHGHFDSPGEHFYCPFYEIYKRPF
jgi:hypothetical protein